MEQADRVGVKTNGNTVALIQMIRQHGCLDPKKSFRNCLVGKLGLKL